MATSARSRGLPNYAMPSGSGPGSDKPQQPISSGFSGSNLYPNANIWNSFSVIDRPIGSREADENPSGSSALNVNSEADVWGSRPWNTDGQNRPVSTSPQRTRDGTVTNGSAFFDRSVGLRNGNGLGGTAFQGEGNGYNTAFGAPKRASQESSYIDSLPSFSHSRDTSIPPSRQSQGSPGYPSEAYRGHTPNNSIHSQRIAPNHSASLSVQSLNPTINQNINQRAFNLNRQIEDDVSAQFSRATLDGPSNGGSAFNPASNPFQLNPNTQPWLNDNGISPRLGNGLDMNGDTLASQLAMRRPSAGRISPGATYRLESSANPRSYAPTPDPWAPSRPSSKDPRTNEFERRSSMQQSYPQNMQTPFYPNQYPFSNFTPQYPPNPYDPYGNTSYRNPLIPNYGIPSINQSYPLNSMQNAARSSRDQDPSKGVRSAVLDSFRTNNKSSRRYELRDIYDHVVEFSGDQHGSRFIQQKLETANSDEKEVVFREIAPNAIQLMKDVFGNYVVQKFFEHGNQVQKKILADKMKGKIVDLSVQIYACRVVQKALEHVLVEQQEEMCLELERECLKVMKDQNGNHVIQKVVELVPREHMGFIMDAMRGSISTLAQHMYGCRVIQRILEYGTEEDKAEIMKELYPIANMLIMDQYGNYVAQHVIANGKLEDRTRMIQLVMAQLVSFSRHKFASNVVEKCIQFGTPEQRTSIREGLTGVGSDGNPLLPQLMRDQFGNYVIQKLLVQLQGEEKEILAEEIKPQWSTLKKHGNSRQLQAMEKALGLGQGSGSRPTSGQMDSNSQGPTPVLTNETNSPQSSSPPSTHASALEQASGDAAANKVNGVDPEVQTTST